MKVIKRDGSSVKLDKSQIRKQTEPACKNLKGTSFEELELDSDIFFRDGIHTKEISNALVRTAVSKITIERSNWSYVAGRLLIYNVYHEVKLAYGKSKSGNVYDLVSFKDYINKNKDLFSEWYTKYTDEEIEELNKIIIPENDELFGYMAAETMIKRYLIKRNSLVHELPQHLHLAVSMFLFQNEVKSKRMKLVKKYYKKLSNLKIINPTPINTYGRLKRGSLISCLVGTVPDNLNGMFDMYKEVAVGSSLGSGWGLDWSRVRSLGSWIGDKKGVAGGKIPFLKVENDLSLAVDQQQQRPGAFAVYISSWDIDIFDFLDLKKKHGDDRRRTQDLFLGIMFDDLFMERCEVDGDYTLFDPYDVKMLTETYGQEFKNIYTKAEDEFKKHPEKFNDNTKTIKALDLMRRYVTVYSDEGMPFPIFKDTVNEDHKRKELGIIRSLNLCTEVAQATDDEHTAVCNLSSLNLATIDSKEDLIESTQLVHRALDNAVDLTAYPSLKAETTQLFRRSIGIGVLGEAEALVKREIYYGSDEHLNYIDEVYGTIEDTVNAYNKVLGAEKGTQEGYVDRNLYTRSPAPNSTSGLFAGTTNGHEPVYNIAWIEENLLGSFTMTAPNITPENAKYYINPYEVGMIKYIKTIARKQKYVDQSLSSSVYFNPEMTTGKDVYGVIILAWKLRVKSLYYFRSEPPKSTQPKNVKIKCVGCEN